MKTAFLVAIVFSLFHSVTLPGQDLKADSPAAPDSSKAPDPVLVTGYLIDTAATAVRIPLTKGDSVFVYGGELYFRARAGGTDFFVPAAHLLSRSDSLVVYQNLRLSGSKLTSGPTDSSSPKAVRQRCFALTKNGTRCKRFAVPGSDKCWQHKDE